MLLQESFIRMSDTDYYLPHQLPFSCVGDYMVFLDVFLNSPSLLPQLEYI